MQFSGTIHPSLIYWRPKNAIIEEWRRHHGHPTKQFSILFIMKNFFVVISFIHKFDLASILKSIAFPFVFVFVCYSELIEYFTQCNLILPEIKSPAIAIHPLFLINEQFQSVTVKNIRKMQSFPKSYRKQDMINALLYTY